jgi:hypothetical protein
MSFLLAIIKLAALAVALVCLSAIGLGVQPAGAEWDALPAPDISLCDADAVPDLFGGIPVGQEF